MAEVIGNHWSRGASWTKFVWSSICWICCERDKSKKLSELGWEKGPNWECTFAHRKQVGYSYEQKWGYSGSTKKSKEQSVLPLWWTYVISRMRSQAELVKNYRGIIVHQRLTDPRRMVLLRDRHAELKKELLQCCHNPVWTKNGGLILWNVTVTCETFKTSWRMGKHLTKGDSENHWNAQWFFFGSNGWMLSEICWRPVMAPPIWQDSFTWNVPRLCSNRGENVERRCSGRRHWGAGKFGRVRNPRRLKCKVITPQLGEQLHIPSRWWKIQTVCAIVWKKPWIPKIHFRAGSTCKKRRAQWRLSRKFGQVSTKRRSNVRRSSPWRFLVDRKELHLSSSRRTSGSTSTCRKKKTFTILLKYILTWPGPRTQIWTCCRKAVQIDIYRIQEPDSHCSHHWMKIFQQNVWVRGADDKNSSNYQTGSFGQKHLQRCQKLLNERKNSNGLSKNRSSTMRERREASILSIRMIKSSKKPWKKRKGSEQVPMETAVPCKLKTTRRVRTGIGKQTADPTKSKNQSMHAS